MKFTTIKIKLILIYMIEVDIYLYIFCSKLFFQIPDEFIKDNYKADFNQRNVLYIGNLNNMNNFQKSTLTNDQNTRKTNYKPSRKLNFFQIFLQKN